MRDIEYIFTEKGLVGAGKPLDFNNPGVTYETLMELLLFGHKSILCYNLNISDELGKTVERCYYEKHPWSFKTPILDLYDPSGDNKVYIATLKTKWGRKINWSIRLTKSNKK